MNELILKKQLVNISIYNKIHKRVSKIKQLDIYFQKFLIQSHMIYQKFAYRYNQHCQNFDQSLMQSNFYSSSKCLQILAFTNIFKQLALSIKKNTHLILIGLKKIQGDQADKLQKKFQQKLTLFFKLLNNYESQSKSLQKIGQSYVRKCNNLNKALQQFNQYKDPHSFYNPIVTYQFTKQLDQKLKNALTKQSKLKQQMDKMKVQKRKLQMGMNQIKQSTILNFRYHTFRICEMVKIIIQDTQCENIEMKKQDNVGVIEQFCETELERLKQYYQIDKNKQNKLNNKSGIQNNLSPEINFHEVNTNHKFFLQRCQNFIRMKKKSIQYSNTFRRKSKQFLIKLIEQMIKLKLNYQQLRLNIFGNNKQQKFKKNIKKYLGDSVYSIFKLVNKIVQRPLSSIIKIQKYINLKIQKFETILCEQDNVYQMFNKQIQHLFIQHKKLKNQTVNNNKLYPQQLKKNVQITFQTFYKILSNFKEKQNKIHQYFIDQFNQIIFIIQKQSFKKTKNQILQQYQNLYQNFLHFNHDLQVLKIIKSDNKYQIMFHPFFSGTSNLQFISFIKLDQYKKMKKILQRKQGINRSIKRDSVGCCGLQKKHIVSGKQVYKYNCSLLNKQNYNGELILLDEGITFRSKNTNFLEQKTKVMIPKSDLKKYEKKDSLQNFRNVISIHTIMGEIIFSEFQNRDIVIVNLINLYFHDKKQFSSSSQKSISIRINSSDLKGNNDNTGIMKGADSSCKQNLKKKSTQNNISIQNQIKLFEQKWSKQNNFFSILFKISKQQKKDKLIKSQYIGRFNNIQMKLKQHKQLKYDNNNNNKFWIDFKWKLSVPTIPIINSILIQQRYTVQIIDSSSISISYGLKKYNQLDSYLFNIFYKEIEQMNITLAKFISNNITNIQCNLYPLILQQNNKLNYQPQQKVYYDYSVIKKNNDQSLAQKNISQSIVKKVNLNHPELILHHYQITKNNTQSKKFKFFTIIILLILLLLTSSILYF